MVFVFHYEQLEPNTSLDIDYDYLIMSWSSCSDIVTCASVKLII